MKLLLVPVPLFDRYLAVEAYFFRYRLEDGGRLAPQARSSPLLEALGKQGIKAFTGTRPIFVPVTLGMLEELSGQCTQPEELTVFYLEDISIITKTHIGYMRSLKKRGYRFAILQEHKPYEDKNLMAQVDFVFFGKEPMEHSDRKAQVVAYNYRGRPSPKVIATGIASGEELDRAKRDGFHYFEGMFYRAPVTDDDRKMSPLKINLIRLLNLVRDENFEFTEIAGIMSQDPALSYSLMRFINSPYLGIRYKVKSIQHAVTILGQIEVRKWVTAAVFKALGSDQPSELVRISLVRAKFAESVAVMFGMPEDSPSLFLMGLFSSLDAMLGTTLEDAFERVQVSDEITDALLNRSGKYAPVLEFFLDYERADWNAVESHIDQYSLDVTEIYNRYLMAIGWYNDLINETDKLRRPSRARPRRPEGLRSS